MAMIELPPERLFEIGETVGFRMWVTAKVVGIRWIDLGQGQGIWKYMLANGLETTGSGLQKIDEKQ